MNYRVRRRGEELGTFSPDDLRRRREAGEFSGDEYVQAEGMNDWQPLDLVLRQGYVRPPPLPGGVANRSAGPNPVLVWTLIVFGAVVFVVIIAAFVRGIQRAVTVAQETQTRYLNMARPDALAAATKPVVWTTNTLTEADAQKRAREFRIRQWVDGYQKRGERNPECDAEIVTFLQTWIARNYGGAAATNTLVLSAEADKLARDTNCTDPLALTAIAGETQNRAEAIRCLQRALDAFPKSKHEAYPKFYADVISALDSSALRQFAACFSDGSFAPVDQQEIGEIFVNGWGDRFFERNGDAVCKIANEAGTNFQWLALTLEGENEINLAWAARGRGGADAVTSSGWKGFRDHLAAARSDLTEAWNLRRNYPLAPRLMITVALGDSGITEMRQWFDRTTIAQIDYPGAWAEMRWGLRPRWYGNLDAMLAFGRTAVATRRFDTDVPRKFIDSVYDVEAEMNLPRGHYLFGRADIWPQLQIIYSGYLNEPSQAPYRNGWLTSYAIIACYAGKYDVSRAQLEALNWKPQRSILAEWNLDATLWPLEVAALSGPLGGKVSAAETFFQNGDTAAALKRYKELNSNPDADGRTKEFIRRRLALLNAEQGMLPQQDRTMAIPMPSVTN